jgi:hypothetical protein
VISGVGDLFHLGGDFFEKQFYELLFLRAIYFILKSPLF